MFIKKQLIIDLSAEHIRTITESLKKNNITYCIKTIPNLGIIGRTYDTDIGQHYLASRTMENDGMRFIYKVYVKSRDYLRAKDLIR